jgi:murein DD-endopeptidase MepM/ murein hydrolase activator NlpD
MPINIGASVGRNAANDAADVKAIAALLNKNRHLLIPFPDLPVGSDPSDQLIARIEIFQRRVVLISNPDGRVDPNGQTLAKLNENAKGLPQSIPLFPFTRHPTADFNCCARQFGAPRSGGKRKHAAVDLNFPPGTPIRAIDDGTVEREQAPFYDGTNSFEVDHGWCLARYGEISRVAPGFNRKGAKVKRGEIIAYVGQLRSTGNSMLHLELYSGTSTGGLTDRNRMPYQRRADLLDPMDFIRAAVLTDAGQQDGNARVGHRVTSFLNVRSDSKANASIVIKLPPGQYFDVLAEVTGDAYPAEGTTRSDWLKIDVDGTEGFAAAYYVDRVSTGPTGRNGTVDSTNPLAKLGAFGTVGARVESVLNLRANADPALPIVAKLPPGTLLEIEEKRTGKSYDAVGVQRTDWLKVTAVTAGRDQGFAAAFYVDPVRRTGRTNAAVTSGLRLRTDPDPNAVQLAVLAPHTSFTVVRGVTGQPYPAPAGSSDLWYEVELEDQSGYAAAAFVDLLDAAAPADANAILFTYEPSGASDDTARQDNLPQQGIHGVAASEDMANTDWSKINPRKARFNEVAQRYELPPALLAAIASRETRGGAVLDSEGWGDRGNAFGIMQVDKRWHSPIETEHGPDGEPHIDQATGILKDKLDAVRRQVEGISDSRALQAAVSRYNGGRGLLPPESDKGTTGND